jgi:hypothetical protein
MKMELETFDDVIKSIGKNKNRQFHLLLGNGFSMAYSSKIFSYNALHDFITKVDDEDLSTILKVIESKNFELIMQQLDNLSKLIKAFGGDDALRDKIDQASSKLKTSLLDAVKSLHPPHVFAVPDDESEACAKFLKTFLDTKGSIFSANYDLLLYWILMRNKLIEHNDGFGRELENPDDCTSEEDQEWSELRWGKHKDEQNIHYIHGALPLFDTGIDIIKEEYDLQNHLLKKINMRMKQGEYPVFVTAGNGDDKLSHIMHNRYLSHCYDKLSNIEGSLVAFGFNFGQYDEHIIEAINRATKHGQKRSDRLWSLYIGVYSEEDKMHIENIKDKFKVKVRVFDAKTAHVWR